MMGSTLCDRIDFSAFQFCYWVKCNGSMDLFIYVQPNDSRNGSVVRVRSLSWNPFYLDLEKGSQVSCFILPLFQNVRCTDRKSVV